MGPYRSPEMTRDRVELDGRADVYALSATLYSVLSGKKPFSGSTWIEMVRKIRWESPPLINDFRKDATPMLAACLARAMEKEPERRYADMSFFETALKNSL